MVRRQLLMSSGSFTSPGLGFNNTGKPSDTLGLPCPSMRYEDRGPGAVLAGVCWRCGRTTTHSSSGRPEHDQVPGLSWTHGGSDDPGTPRCCCLSCRRVRYFISSRGEWAYQDGSPRCRRAAGAAA
jgi:hypothetical protein